MKLRGSEPEGVSPTRTSDILRNILLANPNVETFTVEQILAAIGSDRTEASLVLFSLPAMIPAPDLPLAGVTSGMVAGQMAIGRKTIHLPKIVLNKKVPRRSLAIAIHAIVPVIEAAEKIAKPRLRWASSPIARRILGMLVFVLGVAIAFPVIGFDPLHAASISVISLGLAEQDGIAILLGVMAGLISLALIVTSGLTAKILKSKIAKWLRKMARRAGARALAFMCERRGWKWLAAVLSFEWPQILTMWDPERRESEKQARAAARNERPSTRRDRAATVRLPERRTSAGSAGRAKSKSQPLLMA